MAGKKGMKHYSLELKLEAMRMFYEDGKTRKEITEALGIRDQDRVMKWLRQYRREGKDAFLKKRKRLGRPPNKENTMAYIARLEMEVELLKKFHTELRKDLLAKRNIGSSTDTEASTL
jgi:transposase-like protein